jgi:hypothetical protein
MNALLFLAMLAALIAGCCGFVWTLPKQEPAYDASAAPELRRRSWSEGEQRDEPAEAA